MAWFYTRDRKSQVRRSNQWTTKLRSISVLTVLCIGLLVFPSTVYLAVPCHEGKGKGNIDLYSMSSRTHQTCSNMVHTVLPANDTISAFTRKRSQAAPPRIHIANALVQLATHLSTPRRMNGWVGHGGCLDWDIFPTLGVEPR